MSEAGKEISGSGQKVSTNVSVLLIKIQSRTDCQPLNSLHSHYHLKQVFQKLHVVKNVAWLCSFNLAWKSITQRFSQ